MTHVERAQPDPFRIRVEQQVLDDLQERLARTRWGATRESDGWEQGTSRDYLRRLIHYWRSGYDWRRHEAKLNTLAQFKARVDRANVHFVHARGHGLGSMPLLLLHGWPDSFYRFHKVVSSFAEPARAGYAPSDSFDVVVPSLPGFAFTGAVQHENQEQPARKSAELI